MASWGEFDFVDPLDRVTEELLALHDEHGVPIPQPVRLPWTRDRLVERAREIAGESAAPLTLSRFCQAAGLSTATLYRHFPSGWPELLAAAELPPPPPAKQRWSEHDLLAEWDRLVRRFGRPPKWGEVDRYTQPGATTFQRRLGTKPEITRKHAEWRERTQPPEDRPPETEPRPL